MFMFMFMVMCAHVMRCDALRACVLRSDLIRRYCDSFVVNDHDDGGEDADTGYGVWSNGCPGRRVLTHTGGGGVGQADDEEEQQLWMRELVLNVCVCVCVITRAATVAGERMNRKA